MCDCPYYTVLVYIVAHHLYNHVVHISGSIKYNLSFNYSYASIVILLLWLRIH